MRRTSPSAAARICASALCSLRLEAQVAILSFFRRYPAVRLADPANRPQWRTLPFFRGLKEIVVEA